MAVPVLDRGVAGTEDWSTPQPTVEYAISCGGAPYESTVNGIYYSVDVKFGFGPNHRTGVAIGYGNNNGVIDGTDDDCLFKTRRYLPHGYWLLVSRPGRYFVIISGMESDRPWIGGRVYTLSLEGVKADTIDHYLHCGAPHRACYNAYYVYVWDGMLNTYVDGDPQINSLIVIRDEGAATIPAGIYVPPAGKPYGWKLQNGNMLVAINCGAGEVVDSSNNIVWFTDTYFSAAKSGLNVFTSTYGTALTSGYTVAPQLYVSQRQGSAITCEVILPATGITVTLEVFCNEYEANGPGRTQTINVENGQVTDGPFDVYVCAGNSKNECKRTIPNVVVANNVLKFTLQQTAGPHAIISAFRVIGTAGMPANVATPPPPAIPVIGTSTCAPGTLGCPCLAGNTCNAPYVCSAFDGCQVQPAPPPSLPPAEHRRSHCSALTFAPAPPLAPSASAGSSKGGGGSKTGVIVAVVVVLVVLALVAAAVVPFMFRDRLFGGKSGHRPTFHEEEMYAQKPV